MLNQTITGDTNWATGQGVTGDRKRFSISADGYTLEFVCGTTTVVDELRILTAVPEPASLLALSAGVASLVGLRRRKR